ncbi:MAG TPA: cupin domain-containing protein, partial [Baekduia sp.]
MTQQTNIFSIELGAHLDEAGFRHRATAVGARLGARRIGAGVYDAEAGLPIWPYHYHYGVEEWLYVIAGAPVLREPAGERALTPGDLVCFPSGHLGAHTVSGPGRFLMFSTGHEDEPWMSVYPDSDKISGPGGVFPRASAVDYWQGEGTVGPSSQPVEVVREPATSPARPVVNVLALALGGRLGPRLGAERLDATVAAIDPGARSDPYHYTYGREEWLLVLAGTPTVRLPDGERSLAAGDLVCFPEGPAGAHRLINRSDAAVRALVLSTTGLPANVCHPDTGQWVIHNADEVTAYVEARRGTVRAVTDPVFRLVAPASALEDAPAGWARELLRQGEMALALDA